MIQRQESDQHANQVSSSATYWPNSQFLRNHIALPLTLIVSPFNQSHYIEYSVSRCQSCKAFLNPYCKIKNQYQYQCSICGCTNNTNTKINLSSIELNKFSYECQAPQSIQLRYNQKNNPLIIFILDISANINFNQAFATYSLYLLKQFLLEKIQKQEDINIIIMTFDDYVHQYKFQQQQIVKVVNSEIDFNNYQVSPQSRCIGSLIKFKTQIIHLIQHLQSQVKSMGNGLIRKPEHKSKAIIQAIYHGLNLSKQYSGKLYLLSSISQPLQSFKLAQFEPQQRLGYLINKNNCLPPQLLEILSKTQISISLSIMAEYFINAYPLHIITKLTNGQLRHYNKNESLTYFYQLRFQLLGQFNQLRRETILRVRYSSGLKFIGAFGGCRPTNINDQLQLISCPLNRKYLLEFLIEGKILQPQVIIQISLLYKMKGKRIFKIINYKNEITSDLQKVIKSINYPIMCFSYIKAINHNLDLHTNFRYLRYSIKQRCRKHINTIFKGIKQQQNMIGQYPASFLRIQNNQQHQQQQPFINKQQQKNTIKFASLLKNAQSYALTTYYLIINPLLNMIYQQTVDFDKNFDKRNKISTFSNPINLIWPLYYIITNDNIQLCEPKLHQFSKKKLGILVDLGDHCELYLQNKYIVMELLKMDKSEIYQKIITFGQQYYKLAQFLEKLKEQKQRGYLTITIKQNLNDIRKIDEIGVFNYAQFISNVMQPY